MDRITSLAFECPNCGSSEVSMIDGVWVKYCEKCKWNQMDDTHEWDEEKMALVRKENP